MKTLREETASEAASALNVEESEPVGMLPRTQELNDFARRTAGMNNQDLFLRSSPADRLRAGWRRPSAPSIFHNMEFGRRPSLTSLLLPGASAMHTVPPVPENASAPSNTVALRRPSAVVLHMPTAEDKLRLMDNRPESATSCTPLQTPEEDEQKFDDTITVYLSAMYAKLLVTLGIAFPIIQTIALDAHYYQGFHLYLYVGTFVFLSFTYAEFLQSRVLMFIVNSYRRKASHPRPSVYSVAMSKHPKHREHYGSFYLRLGAIAFGIGSMVYSGLEFGQYWELRVDCRRVTQALTPAARMVLTLVQMQFIFLKHKRMVSQNSSWRTKLFAQFGLMHMIATNLCEWLTVIIEEAKHEIEHLPSDQEDGDVHGHGHGHGHEDTIARVQLDSLALLSSRADKVVGNSSGGHGKQPHHFHSPCSSSSIISSLVRNASPFLFPCTIEYSLICAVVLFEMWKNTFRHNEGEEEHEPSPPRYNLADVLNSKSAHHLSVDCTKAHKGMFGGIVIVVLTIISLILFFVLQEAPGFQDTSQMVVIICELSLYVITGLAVLAAFYKMRTLKHNPNLGAMNLDNTLLVIAQTGVFLYNLFSIVAYVSNPSATRNLVSELCGLIQTIGQTIFVLDASRRRCWSAREWRHKPGRQLVTFLLVSNMAMWIVNTLEKGRASSRPLLLTFYGNWPWTLIVHISMPLAIFYRFHSTICLFEIWKSCYKFKPHTQRLHSERSEAEAGDGGGGGGGGGE